MWSTALKMRWHVSTLERWNVSRITFHVLRIAYCVALRSTLTAPRIFILGGARRAGMGTVMKRTLLPSPPAIGGRGGEFGSVWFGRMVTVQEEK